MMLLIHHEQKNQFYVYALLKRNTEIRDTVFLLENVYPVLANKKRVLFARLALFELTR
jgi:hypothetical protein